MHNRKKPGAPPSEAEVNALKEKTTKYKALVDMILLKRINGDKSTETLVLVGKLVQINPDFYSLWNMRRDILFSLYPVLIEASPENRFGNTTVRDTELSISADGIRRNPKACEIIFLVAICSIISRAFAVCICRWSLASSIVDC